MRNRKVKPVSDIGRPRARRSIYCSGALVMLALVVAALAIARPLNTAHTKLEQVRRADLALKQVADFRTTLTDFQLKLETSFALADPSKEAALSLGETGILAQNELIRLKSMLATLPSAGVSAAVGPITAANAAYVKSYTALSPLLAGESPATFAGPIAAERKAFRALYDLSAPGATKLQSISGPGMAMGLQKLEAGQRVSRIIFALTALLTLLAAIWFGQRSHRRERAERRTLRRSSFATSLQEALDMARAEADVYGVVDKAIDLSLPHLQVEVLIADSSRAHFSKLVKTGDSGPHARSGCGVVSPLDCPAVSRGHTLLFPTSTAINACPYLQGRPSGDCSAVCVPISLGGKTVGVTHAVGPDGQPPTPANIDYLEITSRRASERVTLLRSFEKSEIQAASDPLTGLWNRRSLENRVQDLQREGISYGLAYGDLDNFKLVNDTHGHEAGDQALRLFSRVLRDSVRPNDIAARYGGEEFVIVLPECDTAAAKAVLERVRENLAIALTSGRVAAFTVSFGLASSGDGDTFEAALNIADRALLTAKANGRNRVVVAHEYPNDTAAVPVR